ncbi:hypothetical protein [Promicromonospora sp. NPDC023805]|uniref:hypothetical protein n=1 Tax=Promicromonospora sp. NPDC023805 TaxID=3154696 RepID=UPI0033EA29A4
MEWTDWLALISASALVSAAVSSLVQWGTGLHRDRATAKRDRLYLAVADLIAAESIRWDVEDRTESAFHLHLRAMERGENTERAERELTEARESWLPALIDSRNALARIRMVSADVGEAAAALVDMSAHRANPDERAVAVDALVTAARKELGFG